MKTPDRLKPRHQEPSDRRRDARRTRRLGVLATVGAAALALTACTPGGPPVAELDNGDQGEITIAVFAGWPEGIAVSQLWRAVLEDEGYDVTLTDVDVAPGYSGVASGDYDLVMDSWLPNTHADYVDRFGDDMTDLGAWYREARNTIVVNEDAPITSLDELAANADLFGNTIVGLEPGAGLTQITEERAIPAYGLESMDFVTSSTAALLTELQAATDAGENVVVTLARPHWAYDAYPIRDLEDPEGAMGPSEEIHSMASSTFDDDFATASGWLRDFELSEDDLLSLCNAMFNVDGGADGTDYEAIVRAWMDEHPDVVEALTAG
ncbi:glycine betaine ABC transporter substrate-binding protein [Frigoribacterium sp. PhB24]|uniref:glycine betaine ABC transporter substrate-binding protein n=1 Tax=Frigoribacterium sp. PhB24 TaxID=2485204 RepID=UPI000FA17D1C|nr:glycine betaine ABC transporter substrate-binding protein [Frigoribacterium sp. PhB24]ROS54080.1 glycine betaine/proline transport system substrate-binding protein [Frigoribacterium sp. PhB24]